MSKIRTWWLEMGNECDDIIWHNPVNENTIKVIAYDDHQAIVQKLERKIEILESKASQFESTIKETMKKTNERCEKLRGALQFYADENSYYLIKDPHLGTEVRRSLIYDDTESFGFQDYQESKNILQVVAGKTARQAIKEDDEALNE